MKIRKKEMPLYWILSARWLEKEGRQVHFQERTSLVPYKQQLFQALISTKSRGASNGSLPVAKDPC
jgi:hypothetical protein